MIFGHYGNITKEEVLQIYVLNMYKYVLKHNCTQKTRQRKIPVNLQKGVMGCESAWEDCVVH